MRAGRVWLLAALLLPQPLLTLGYLRAVRAELLEPRFAPVILLGALPLAAIVLAGPGAAPGLARGWRVALIAIGVAELAWAVLAAAIVGFAIGWRSG